MVIALRLLFRPFERFFAQWVSVTTEPSTFVRERIRLGDTTNFYRAVGFFISAISTAFLAELATLYVLGIGGLAEPYYWLFIVLTSIPFVLICFLLLRIVAPLSLRDVLHLSLHPLGAGVFAGAIVTLIAAAVVSSFVSIEFIPAIQYDFSQWGNEAQMMAVNKRVLNDCLKQENLVFAILAAGLQEAYTQIKPPIDNLSYVRPVTTVLYLFIAAIVFAAAVKVRKAVIFGLVVLAALIATGMNALSASIYIASTVNNSPCTKRVESGELGLDLVAASALKAFVMDLNKDVTQDDKWDVSYRADGRVLFHIYRAKVPIVDTNKFLGGVSKIQKDAIERYCSPGSWFIRRVATTETQIFYDAEGQRLTSFSVTLGDCPQWEGR